MAAAPRYGLARRAGGSVRQDMRQFGAIVAKVASADITSAVGVRLAQRLVGGLAAFPPSAHNPLAAALLLAAALGAGQRRRHHDGAAAAKRRLPCVIMPWGCHFAVNRQVSVCGQLTMIEGLRSIVKFPFAVN